jgi:hypothetical protein
VFGVSKVSGEATATQIRLLPPQVQGHEVEFGWIEDRETTLYRRPAFTLKFPDEVDLSKVPQGLLWRVALICLHSQWILLQPCSIEIPISLPPGELEVWQNLVNTELRTLNAYGKPRHEEAVIEITARGPISHCERLEASLRCATAFSGGKDSLLQTGLLTELTQRPVLVTITSPMPLLDDHLTERRRQLLDEVARRSDVQLVEVQSDYRSNLDHAFAQRLGYATSVNEITDAFLYLGCLIIVGAALGASHLFLASELEVQENTSINGEVVQHPHFMYSVITQSAMTGLLRDWGLHYSSLISPLHSSQAQELLVKRYPNLWHLQYSCWRVRMGESACNACPQCLRIAFSVLSWIIGPQQSASTLEGFSGRCESGGR